MSNSKKKTYPWNDIYLIVFDHFKEQDILRNAVVLVFITITGIAYEMFMTDVTVTISLFIIGTLLQLVISHHKKYGEMYYLTLRIIQILFLMEEEQFSQEYIDDVAQQVINKYRSSLLTKRHKIMKVLWSVDGLIYCVFIIVNAFNLLKALALLNISVVPLLICIVVYMIGSLMMYETLVVKMTKQLKPVDLSFIRTTV